MATYKTETQPIKWQQAVNLLDAMRDRGQDNTRLMLACGFFFGLRIGDILSLRWEDILSDEFTLSEKKTGKTRTISLDIGFKRVRDQVVRGLMIDLSALVFTHQRQDGDPMKPISVVAANKRIKKIFLEYDIRCKNPSSHTLRKTFGLRVYEVHNRCEDGLILLSQMFNHKDISVTRRYIGITERRIQNAYLSLSSGKAAYH